jgi:hypothetical protein
MAVIVDGSSGVTAKVNAGNRLYTRSVSNTEGQQANINGDAYNINTGYITLTNAVDTPVMYVKNNEDEALIIEAIAVGIQPSANGVSTEEPYITVVRNPTGGTIISSPANVDINSNRNYGSQNSIVIDAYKGATNKTLTGGEDHLLIQQNDGGRAFASINEVLPKGASIGVKIKPPTSNTSMDVYVALIVYLRDLTE